MEIIIRKEKAGYSIVADDDYALYTDSKHELLDYIDALICDKDDKDWTSRRRLRKLVDRAFDIIQEHVIEPDLHAYELMEMIDELYLINVKFCKSDMIGKDLISDYITETINEMNDRLERL